MDPTERFTDVVRHAESDIELDEACLLIAAHAHPSIDIDARRAQLDALARSGDAAEDIAAKNPCAIESTATSTITTPAMPTTATADEPRRWEIVRMLSDVTAMI